MLLRLLPWLLAILVWILVVALPGDHWAAKTPRVTQSAQLLVAEGKHGQALALLDGRPTGRTPGIDQRIVTAFAALGQGLSARARSELDSALLIDGGDPQVWLGRCLLSGVDDPPDPTPCRRATELSAHEPECAPLLARAWGALRRGRLSEARTDLEQCAALDPDHGGVGRLTSLVERAEQAQAELERQEDAERDGSGPSPAVVVPELFDATQAR